MNTTRLYIYTAIFVLSATSAFAQAANGGVDMENAVNIVTTIFIGMIAMCGFVACAWNGLQAFRNGHDMTHLFYSMIFGFVFIFGAGFFANKMGLTAGALNVGGLVGF
jgi:hypothetical protein